MTRKVLLVSLLLFVPMASSVLAQGKAAPKKGAPAAKSVETPAKTLPQPKEMATLGVIDGETQPNGDAVLTVRLDRKPAWDAVPELQDHGSFLQLVLPDTIVPEPGKFFDGAGPLLPKIAVFQLTANDAGVRLFVGKDASRIKAATTAALLDKRIVFTVDQAKLEALLAASEATPAGPAAPRKGPLTAAESLAEAQRESADDVIARTEVSRDIPPPADLLRGAGAQKPGPVEAQGGGFDLRGKLTEVALFFGALFGLLLVSLALKPYMRRRAVAASGGEEPISMKMLGSLALASRQKLSLIQVGDEKILIGVGPDSVTFIANVGRGEGRVQRLTEATLAKAIPQAQPRLAAFESVLAREAAAPLEQAPKLKKIPGNDEASLRDEPEAAPPVKKPEPAPRREAPKRPAPSRVNVAVGEDGVQDLRTANATAGARPKDDSAKPASRESVDDVTKLIREKLRQLKTI